MRMTTVVWPHRANPLLGMMNTAAEKTSPRAVATAGRTLRVVMAGGGTGGHLYPGLAVAEALRSLAGERGLGLELTWAATPRAVDQRLLSGFGTSYVKQTVQPLVKSVKKIWPFIVGWRESCALWGRRFGEQAPDCVVALGGYAAGPAAYVASKRGIPVVLLNPDALPGLANRFLFKHSTTVVTQWAWEAAGAGGKWKANHIRGRVKALGCPIRVELTQRSREEGVARLGIDGTKKTLVVTGASLGAKTINEAVLAYLGDAGHRRTLAARGWQIVHLAGIEQARVVRAAYAKWPPPGVSVKVIDYCDDMASVWAVADGAIGRAGASTCAELTACGVPSILMPYPFHKDLHQKANAMELVRAGAALIVEDAKDAAANAAGLKPALESLLYDDDLRNRMAEAARVAGKPNAAVEIAKEILALTAGSLR